MELIQVATNIPDVKDFSVICRICLEKKMILRSIFNPSDRLNEDTNNNIHKKLTSVSNIQVKLHDNLPQNICIKCLNFLCTAYFFKNLCQDSDTKLRNVLRESKVSQTTVDSEDDLKNNCDNLKHMNIEINNCDAQDMQIGECSVVLKTNECSDVLKTNEIKDEPLVSSGEMRIHKLETKDSCCDKKNIGKISNKECSGDFSCGNGKQMNITKIGECTVKISINDVKKEPLDKMVNNNNINNSNNVLSQHSDGLVYFNEDTNDYCPSNASSDSLDWNIPLNELATSKRMRILPLQPENIKRNSKITKIKGQDVLLKTDNVSRRNSNHIIHSVLSNKTKTQDSQITNSLINNNNNVEGLLYLNEACTDLLTDAKNISSQIKSSEVQRMKILPLKCKNTVTHHKTRRKISSVKDKLSKHTQYLNVKNLKHAVLVNKNISPLEKCQLKLDRFKTIKEKSIKKSLETVCKKVLPAKKTLSNECLGYFECLICNVKYNEKVSLYKHMASEHKDKRGFKCYACNLTFNSIRAKDEHKKKHCPNEKINQDSNYECKTCKMLFTERSSYTVHMKKHKEEIDSDIFELKYLFKCDNCSYSTSNKNTLKNHLISKHPFNNSLIKHFVCETCGKNYTNNSSFWKHTMTHASPGKIYKCSYCDYKTQYSNGIKRHEQTHTRECQYTCEECGKSFITSGALSVHKKRHTGVRDYQCNLCEKNYARKCELTGHIESVHEKIRPYKCIVEHCNSAFYQRNKCVKHLRNVHKITTKIDIPSIKKKKEL